MRAGKDAALDPGVEVFRNVAPDGMNQPAALALEAPVYHRPEFAVAIGSDMLQHADGYEGIEFALYVAVVVLDELDPAAESFGARPFAGMDDLLPGNVERLHRHAVILRHVQRECAPAAARL